MPGRSGPAFPSARKGRDEHVRSPERHLSRNRYRIRRRGLLAVPLGTAAAALLASAGPAVAGTGFGQLIVNPGTAAPGQNVSVLGTCPNNGQGLRGVFSAAFVGGSASVTPTQINFSGSATIAPGASGTYTVTADCGTGSPSVTITVSGAVVTPSQPAPTTRPPMPNPSPSAVRTSAMAVMPPAMNSAMAGGYTHSPAKPSSSMGGGMGSAMGAGMGASANPGMGVGMGTGAGASGMARIMSPSPGATAAGNGPVTSTGVVRVGLAGSSKSAMTTAGAAAIAVAAALAGGAGFLVIRRHRRNTSGTHS